MVLIVIQIKVKIKEQLNFKFALLISIKNFLIHYNNRCNNFIKLKMIYNVIGDDL